MVLNKSKILLRAISSGHTKSCQSSQICAFFSKFFAFWGELSVNWICLSTHQPFSLHETKNQAKIPIQLDFIDYQSMAEFRLLFILSTIEKSFLADHQEK